MEIDYYFQTDDCEDHEEYSASIPFRIVDFGIGPYEYWGARGVHKNLGAEVIEEQIVIHNPKDEKLSGPELISMREYLMENYGDRIIEKCEEEYRNLEHYNEE